MRFLACLLLKFGCGLGLLALASCALQKTLPRGPAGDHPASELEERVRSKPQPAVLFVGNSYSFGVPGEFSKLAAARGKSVRVGHSTSGGWSLAWHAADEGTLRKIRDGHWDIVVFQEHSEIPALPPRRRNVAMFPPLRLLVTEARTHGAVAVLYQTWGRREGDPHVRHDDFHAMTARLREGYQAAAKNAGKLVVVPVGDAWEREFLAGRGSRLFIADGSHPSSWGNRFTAEVFYQTFFGK